VPLLEGAVDMTLLAAEPAGRRHRLAGIRGILRSAAVSPIRVEAFDGSGEPGLIPCEPDTGSGRYGWQCLSGLLQDDAYGGEE